VGSTGSGSFTERAKALSSEKTREFLTDLFEQMESGDYMPLLGALSENLTWTVTGSSPISRVYQGKDDYVRNCYGALNQRLTTWPSARVKQLIVDDDRAVVFFQGVGGLGRNGIDYSMEYCWAIHVAEDKIDEVIGFYDGNRVSALFN
jgi:ketosteroid isomerase-like protein